MRRSSFSREGLRLSYLLVGAGSAAAVALLLLAGCSSGRGAAPREPQPVGPARPLSFRLRGETLHGRLYGAGRDGVVLANESDLDQGSWAAFARTLARHGYRALSFDYGSAFPEDEAAAAAEALRQAGARSVALLGASEGAKAAIMAAVAMPPAFSAVVSLSAERYAQGRDVLRYARRLTVPALFVTARGDAFSAEDTPLLERAAVSPEKHLVRAPGDAHGVALLADAAVRARILAFLARQFEQRLLVVRTTGAATRRSSGHCVFVIDAPLAGGGRSQACLTSVNGFPGPDAVIHSRGRMTLTLPGGTIRARVTVVQRFAADGRRATQQLTGSVTGGSGRYDSAAGTIAGGGTLVDTRSALTRLRLSYRLMLH